LLGGHRTQNLQSASVTRSAHRGGPADSRCARDIRLLALADSGGHVLDREANEQDVAVIGEGEAERLGAPINTIVGTLLRAVLGIERLAAVAPLILRVGAGSLR
jgi:hypothetical protein